jgi:hydroxymethylglutaryl-CoA reductase
MALHARTVAMTAGARGDEIRRIAGELTRAGEVRLDAAARALSRLRGEVVT